MKLNQNLYRRYSSHSHLLAEMTASRLRTQ